MKLKAAVDKKGVTFAHLERVTGIPARTLSMCNSGQRSIPKKYVKTLKSTFKKYGIKYIFTP